MSATGSGFTHWGTGVAGVLKSAGVETIFTLSGAHIFFIYDGARAEGINIVDVRHEATAAFAADAWARLTLGPGVAAVTAGPGAFNTINGLATASKNQVPLVVLSGRAPQSRWGTGSLQEVDHVPVAASLAKVAETGGSHLMSQLSGAITQALTAPRGPVFIDVPFDLDPEAATVAEHTPPTRAEPDGDAMAEIAKLLKGATKPVLIAGSNVYMDRAWDSMRAFVEAAQIPVFTNGMGRGTIAADHPLAFSRARSKATRSADVVIVAGTPLDFRLGFGAGFDAKATVVHLDSAPELVTTNIELAASCGADLDLTFTVLADIAPRCDSAGWVEELRAEESSKAQQTEAELATDSSPIHPLRVYGELRKILDRDAIVICDGGDFVSYAGREIASYEPGHWLDPGPFGCLGTGPGYAIAARLRHPDKQVVLMLGDGAFGFSGLEFDTMVRHGLPVVGIMGNNGIWGLEKHPMNAFFGYDVAADLRQETRYDKVVEALGGYGERVTEPDQILPALQRAFASGVPALVNIHTDPSVAYPRSANLA